MSRTIPTRHGWFTKNRELRELVKLAQEQGWDVWKTARGHLRFRPPAGVSGQRADVDHRAGGRTLTHGSTDGDADGIKNFRADLRRAGLKGV